MPRVGFKLKRFARYLGLYKRTITMSDGVRYRERSGISVRRALSEFGPGVKEYDVRFPWIATERRLGTRIRHATSRLYGDIGHDPRTVLYTQVVDLITPGLRVLEVGCGTGSGSSILAEYVGPSGGVVAIDRDGEAIRFARQRHRSNHCGFENGWIETLQGETDDGFDVVVAVDPLRDQERSSDRIAPLPEIIRVLSTGGILVLLVSKTDGPDRLRASIEGVTQNGLFTIIQELIPCHKSGWSGVALRQTGEIKPRTNRDHHTPGSFQF